ncbi:hypothetical protein HA402_003071 [Bradysia odoriphaga]|nr:hypothetical protein HA402_003071 [Bradysia odoriphaga]
MGLLSFAVKGGVLYSAIYGTRHYNVWADSEKTTALYNELSQKASPHLKTVRAKIPLEIPPLPSSGELCYIYTHYHNKAVKNTIYFIHRLPCYLGQWAKKAKDGIDKALEAPPPK